MIPHVSATAVAEPYARYLRTLGFNDVPTGITGLEELVRRHLCRIPFENVSKLLLIAREGAGRITTLTEFLEGIDHLDLGGTCYTSNPFFAELLRFIGYDADLLGADMTNPNVHTVVRVRIDGIAYHVDVGYAAPLYQPIRLDRLPFEVVQGDYRYVVEGDGSGECRMKVWRGRELAHGYAVHQPPRSLQFFRGIILDSYAPGRTFTSCLRITRFFDRHAVELRDANMTLYRGEETEVTVLRSTKELREAVDRQFAMPHCPIERAVEMLERITGRRFFDEEPAPRL